MPKGYWIVHVDVTDAANYPQYVKLDTPVLEAHGGRFLVRGGQCEGPEGTVRSRHVVVEFDSYERALECYRSEGYQEAARLRQAYSDSEIVIVEGA